MRPRGPSGDDWREVFVKGLAVDEGPFGVLADAGVTVKGMEVLIYGFETDFEDGIREGQPLLPSRTWTGVVAEGMI